MAPRNPPWTRDELILALDLYQRYQGNPPGKSSKEIEEFSETLNQLGTNLAAQHDKFRNVNGCYMKLMNFRRLDPVFEAEGKVGLQRGGKLEEVIWQEFAGDSNGLRNAAKAIRISLNTG